MSTVINEKQARAYLTANLSARLTGLDWTQGDLARCLFGDADAANRVRVSRWINGHVFPNPAELANLAECLQCKVDDLLKRPEKKTRKTA